MKLPKSKLVVRSAFTLVEMLIVIAIIAILVSLISAAVIRGLGTANKVRNMSELRQLGVAVENFKAKYGIYPPSRIILCEKYSHYLTNDASNPAYPFQSPLHADSVSFLTRIFPRIAGDPSDINYPWTYAGANPNSVWVDWNGNGTLDLPRILEGDQCLVFFLGGIPRILPGPPPIPACTGFSTNPKDPSAHLKPPGSDVIAPLHEFQTSRLVWNLPRATYLTKKAITPPPGSAVHLSYLDAYSGAPYAYFSSYMTRNGYNRYSDPNGSPPTATLLMLPNPADSSKPFFSSDCTSLGVWPYAESLKYLNPNSYQIISAGANGNIPKQLTPVGWGIAGFGRGSDLNTAVYATTFYLGVPPAVWTSTTAGNVDGSSVSWNYTGDKEAGLDDQSNFHDSTLGSGTN